MFDYAGLWQGFGIAFSPVNLFWCFVGAMLGTAVGVLPGLGPAATIALLLPISLKMGSPVTSIILMSGIFYGAMYGGSTTSILLKIPGEAASVVTCIDGYEMAKKGRAGAALGVAAIGSFVAGTFGVVGLTAVAPPLAEAALRRSRASSWRRWACSSGASASTRSRARCASRSACPTCRATSTS
jgi:putative tricarboxylic transport membrane protein